MVIKSLILLMLMTSICYADFRTENGLPTEEEFKKMDIIHRENTIDRLVRALTSKYKEDEGIIQELKKVVQDQNSLIDKLDNELSKYNYEVDVFVKKDIK